MSRWGLFLVLGQLVLSQAVPAQTVAVSIGAGPVLGLGSVTVEAIDSTGRAVVRLALEDDSISIELPESGTWTIRATHLGFRPAQELIVVPPSGFARVHLELHPDPLPLAGLVANAEAKCDSRSRAEDVLRLWTEARVVLLGESEARRDPVLTVEVASREFESGAYYVREELPPGYNIRRRDADTVRIAGLLRLGYPDEPGGEMGSFIRPSFEHADEHYLFDYFAPYPRLLLSEQFATYHCFSIRRSDDRPGMVGLEFKPNNEGGLRFDVEGVLWLPEEEATWPWIEFQYTRLPRQNELTDRRAQACWEDGCRNRRGAWFRYFPAVSVDERFGGRLDLAFVEDFGWIVNRVRLSTPVVLQRQRLAIKPQFEADLVAGRPITASHLAMRDLLTVWYVLEETHRVLAVR